MMKSSAPIKFHRRLSSVDVLPTAVKAQLDAEIAVGRKSVTELTEVARASGNAISRSAVHRYIKREQRRRPKGAGSVSEAVRLYHSLTAPDRLKFRDILSTLEPDWRTR